MASELMPIAQSDKTEQCGQLKQADKSKPLLYNFAKAPIKNFMDQEMGCEGTRGFSISTL